VKAYEAHALSKITCKDWLENNNFDVNNKERLGQSKKFKDGSLKMENLRHYFKKTHIRRLKSCQKH